MKHCSTSYLREKATKVLSPKEETIISLKLFARAFNPRNINLSENGWLDEHSLA